MSSATVSVRMLWPFARVVGDYGTELGILRAAGVDAATLVDADARIPHALARKVIVASIEKTGDVAIGLHAGERSEAADFGVIGYAVRNCPDVRRALLCANRYVRLHDDDVEASLVDDGDRATWQLRNSIPSALPALNDFEVATMLTAVAHFRGRNEPPLEVHVQHSSATNVEEYNRFFRAPVRFGAAHNAVVLPRAALDEPVALANPDLVQVFERQAARLLQQLDSAGSTSARARHLLVKRLAEGDVGIAETARQLHMSVATLRRRLAEEGTTYTALLEESRRKLALHLIEHRHVAIGEIAFLLGFSSQSAFGKAFRRWVGTSPLEYRSQRTSRPRARLN